MRSDFAARDLEEAVATNFKRFARRREAAKGSCMRPAERLTNRNRIAFTDDLFDDRFMTVKGGIRDRQCT